MSRLDIAQWELLERRSPELFLSAGVLLFGYAALNGLVAFTDMAYVAVEDVVAPAGLVLGLLGLLGVYPGLVDRSPKLARIGAVCAGLGALAFSVITLQGLAVLVGFESTSAPGILLLLGVVGMIPGYLSFGVATLRVSVDRRTVGLVLLLPAVVFAAMLLQPFVYAAFGVLSETTMAWSNFGISSAQAVAHLAIGYKLRGRISQNVQEAPFADATVN
jgi:hypothetical protein